MQPWTSDVSVPVVGIDLGGTKVRAALADADGTILAEVTEPTDGGGRSTLHQMARLVQQLTDQAGVRPHHVAVGSPGVVDAAGRFQLSFNIDDLADLSLAAELESLVGVPVTVENDVNVAALGEQWQGLGRGRQHFVVLSVGTGLGMGIVINGELYRGARGFAGEVAYLPLGEDPRSDHSRRVGSLEAAAGTAGIRARITDPLPADADVQQVFDAARRGDSAALQIVTIEADLLARAVLAISAVIDPEIVIVTGGIGSDPMLVEHVRTALAGISPHDIHVERSALGDRCGVIGALAAARAARLHVS